MIKFNSDKYIDLHLPENNGKPKKILILGNTCNMFGYVNEEKEFDISKTCNELNNNTLFNIINDIVNGSTITIIGTKELIDKYYKGLIKHLNNYRKLKHKMVTLEDFAKFKGYEINKEKDFNNLYCEILEDLTRRKMQFDTIIMNPPYDGSLHLKILERAMNMLKDKNSVCINLSPIRWLQDPVAKYKGSSDYVKYENSISKHIKSLDIIDSYKAYTLFDVDFSFDIGVYVLDHNSYTLYEDINRNTIVEKVCDRLLPTLSDFLEKNKIDGARCRLQSMRPLATGKRNRTNIVLTRLFETTSHNLSWVYQDGYTEDGKFWGENVTENAVQHYKLGDMIPESIKFQNIQEAKNFENSTKTDFYRYLVLSMKVGGSYPMNSMPFLYKEINPRTSLKGYKSEWTNEDFYNFFNINKKEQEIIENTMKEYK